MDTMHDSKRSSPGFFSTEDRGNVTVLRFGCSALEGATDLEQTNRLWRFFDSLRETSKKVLLVTSEDGTLSPTSVDRFWQHVRDDCAGRFRIGLRDTVAGGELDLRRESNMFWRFVEVVRALDTFVIATLEKDVDCTLLGPALACDYRVAAEDTLFVNRFLDRNVSAGLLPWFLSRFIGPAAATEFLLRGKIMTAVEALKLGLVNQLVSADDCQAEILAIAEEFADKPANTLAAVKRSMIASFGDLGTYFEIVGTGFDERQLRRQLGENRG
jgi:hypothetical protein